MSDTIDRRATNILYNTYWSPAGWKRDNERVLSSSQFSASADVFANANHPGFSDAFIPASGRTEPQRRFVDMPYPACWWNGAMGINERRLDEYFGHVL